MKEIKMSEKSAVMGIVLGLSNQQPAAPLQMLQTVALVEMKLPGHFLVTHYGGNKAVTDYHFPTRAQYTQTNGAQYNKHHFLSEDSLQGRRAGTFRCRAPVLHVGKGCLGAGWVFKH